MIWLIGMELRKRWESLKWPGLALLLVLSGLVLLAVLLAPDDFAELPSRASGTVAIMAMVSVIVTVMGYYPYVDAAWRFANDFRGRHAPLEFGSAVPTWKKLVAKLIASVTLYLIVIYATGFLMVLPGVLLNDRAAIFALRSPLVAQAAATVLVTYLAVSIYLSLVNRTRWAGIVAVLVGVSPVFLFDMAWFLYSLDLGGMPWYFDETTRWVITGAAAAVGFIGSLVLLDHQADI